RVIFDRGTYADGYIPASDFVVVLDEVTRTPLNTWEYIQVIGDFHADFGGGTSFERDAALDLNDAGSAPDTAAADGIFAVALTPFATNTNVEVKFTGGRTGLGEGVYSVQFGGVG